MSTTTRSSIPRLLRAVASHRILRPQHHISQYPSNLHFFSSTHRRVHTRATAVENPQTPSSIWPYAITFGCIAATGLTVFYKFQQKTVEASKGSLNLEEIELRLEASFPNLFRKGHSVVVEAFARPMKDDESKDDNVTVKGSSRKSWNDNWELYLSATEVLAKPEEISVAMERNKKIIAEKLKIAKEEEEQKIAEKEKLKVAKEAAVDWYTTSSKSISKSAANPLKSKSEAMSPELEFKITKLLKQKLVMFGGLPDLLREGDSVFVKGFEKPFKEYMSYEVLQDKVDEFKEDNSAKSMTFKIEDTEFHISVEVIAKNDEKYMPQEVAAVIIA